METVGIFRRTAAKARVEQLKELIENSPGTYVYIEYKCICTVISVDIESHVIHVHVC